MQEADFIAYGGSGAACSINGELPTRDTLWQSGCAL
jgi:hypothetical protein